MCGQLSRDKSETGFSHVETGFNIIHPSLRFNERERSSKSQRDDQVQ